MFDTVRIALGRDAPHRTHVECRRCGTGLPDPGVECPDCGSTDVAVYEL